MPFVPPPPWFSPTASSCSPSMTPMSHSRCRAAERPSSSAKSDRSLTTRSPSSGPSVQTTERCCDTDSPSPAPPTIVSPNELLTDAKTTPSLPPGSAKAGSSSTANSTGASGSPVGSSSSSGVTTGSSSRSRYCQANTEPPTAAARSNSPTTHGHRRRRSFDSAGVVSTGRVGCAAVAGSLGAWTRGFRVRRS